MMTLVATWYALLSLQSVSSYLYPYESESRETRSLNGLWDFKISPENKVDIGFQEGWQSKEFTSLGDSIKMPVPSSFNDVTTNATIRDYVGWVWYQRTFYAPQRWLQKDIRVFVHFGGVHYMAVIFLNEKPIGLHEGGHLPFQVELPESLISKLNYITVAVNNTLTPSTVPQGEITFPNNSDRYPPGYRLYSHDFDYFDYAGINRPVILFTTPIVYITGINVTTDIRSGVGVVTYNISTSSQSGCDVKLLDKSGHVVAQSADCRGRLEVNNAQLWWPVGTCKKTPGYLYQLQVTTSGQHSNEDVYRLPVGIRTVTWDNSRLFINGKHVFLRGFGMHEDADIRGRGFDDVTMTRDMNLISWIGANAIRTSHYPYAEETLNQADANGILVILEAPACSLKGFGSDLYQRHKEYVLEMMDIHKNRPSVIMWSLANEPLTNSVEANHYFGNLSLVARKQDYTRPITFISSQPIENETAIQHFDIVCVNRYRGWYSDSGLTELIPFQVQNEITAWWNKYSKPVLVTEYGAGSISGLHTLPVSMWSEDYQGVTHIQHFKAFEKLRAIGALAGEMMWNFIDFNTPQEYIRPGRCSKGVFTRERQPKLVAYILRARYQALGNCHAQPLAVLDDPFNFQVIGL